MEVLQAAPPGSSSSPTRPRRPQRCSRRSASARPAAPRRSRCWCRPRPTGCTSSSTRRTRASSEAEDDDRARAAAARGGRRRPGRADGRRRRAACGDPGRDQPARLRRGDHLDAADARVAVAPARPAAQGRRPRAAGDHRHRARAPSGSRRTPLALGRRVAFLGLDADTDRDLRAGERGDRDGASSYDRAVFRSIVVGTDGSETAHEGGRRGVELARLTGRDARARLRLRAGLQPAPARARRARCPPTCSGWSTRARTSTRRSPRRPQRVEAAGVTGRRSTRARAIRPTRSSTSPRSSGADLIVVGNKGMTGAKRFLLGSVPNKVSHHAPCAVMIIRTT